VEVELGHWVGRVVCVTTIWFEKSALIARLQRYAQHCGQVHGSPHFVRYVHSERLISTPFGEPNGRHGARVGPYRRGVDMG
jgi:hypothetical protein